MQQRTEEYKPVKDPVFLVGRTLLKEGKHDDAIEYFDGVLQQRAKENEGGDMSIACASAWYEYGNALLRKEEDAPSDGLLANADPGSQSNIDASQPAEDVPDIEVHEEDEEGDGEEKKEEEEEDVNDLQIAWESFEVSRKIYEQHILSIKESSSSNSHPCISGPDLEQAELELSGVYVRLGDLQLVNEDFASAIDDYNKALEIRSRRCVSYDLLLSDVYYALALAYIYSTSSKGESQPEDTGVASLLPVKKTVLNYYSKALGVIDSWLKVKETLNANDTVRAAEEGLAESIATQRDIREDLAEAIQAHEEEIRALELQAQTSKPAAPVTTIGFGDTPNFPVAHQSTNDYFLSLSAAQSTSSSLTAPSATTVTTLQPKRKQPLSQEPSKESPKKAKLT